MDLTGREGKGQKEVFTRYGAEHSKDVMRLLRLLLSLPLSQLLTGIGTGATYQFLLCFHHNLTCSMLSKLLFFSKDRKTMLDDLVLKVRVSHVLFVPLFLTFSLLIS